MRIAREGYPFILGAALLAVLAWGAGWPSLGAVLAIGALGFVGFFRDPERTPPSGEGLVLSPADGKVVAIKKAASASSTTPEETQVSIFLSPLDVHVNRTPVPGKVERKVYRRGKFFAAYKDRASLENEQNAINIQHPKGPTFRVVQIAGVLARRIVCYVKEGDPVALGQRFGMIMFGSRVDLFLPADSQIEVVEGQKVRGGETIIGRLT